MSKEEVSSVNTMELVQAGLARRYAKERRFRFFGRLAVAIALASLAFLFVDIALKGYSAFYQTSIRLSIELSLDELGISASPSHEELLGADWDRVIRLALTERFSEVSNRKERRKLSRLMGSAAGYQLRDMVIKDLTMLGERHTVWLLAHSKVDAFLKETEDAISVAESPLLGASEIKWLQSLMTDGDVEFRFNSNFFTMGDSRDPESAGILSSLVGSLFMLAVTLLLSFPIGAAAAIYLEEFAPRSRITDLIEVNINNLAAVPSITFGLLGLAIFIQFFGMPRSAPLVGGIVLTLLTLPTIIIASRASIKAVPPSIREAALGVGASQMQTVMHHVLPNALPGMLTGTIIGMARALGETAPLIMIGMVAFIVEVPTGITDPSSALPVQIYLWSDSPERGFVALTSAAILVLMIFLIAMNGFAVYLRRKLEKRW